MFDILPGASIDMGRINLIISPWNQDLDDAGITSLAPGPRPDMPFEAEFAQRPQASPLHDSASQECAKWPLSLL